MHKRFGLKVFSAMAAIAWTQFVDVGTASATVIVISKVDPRDITDVRIGIDYNVTVGQPPAHYDWEQVVASNKKWNSDRRLKLVSTTGTVTNGTWLGNFLQLNSTQPTTCDPWQGCLISITKDDPRAMTDVVVEAWFKINGAWHHDWESAYWGMTGRCGVQRLELDGRGAEWDPECGTPSGGSGCWEGDLLYTNPGPVC